MKALLIALLLVAMALPVQAEVINDVIVADAVTTTQTSETFGSGGAKHMLIAVDVTVCVTSCLFRIWVDQMLPDGTFMAIWAVAAMDNGAVGKEQYLLAFGPANISNSEFEAAQGGVAVPPVWRIRAVWTSGGAATYTVDVSQW